MQIPKSLLLVCAAVVCILPQSVRAADTDAQVKAREALRKKINELQPQPGGVETAAPAQAPVAAGSLDEKTRAAMRQKMNELQAQPAPVVAPPAKTPVPQVIKPAPRMTNAPPAPAQKPAPVSRPAAAPASPQPAPAPVVVAAPAVDSETVSKEREALRKRMEDLQGRPSVVPQPEVTSPAAAAPSAQAQAEQAAQGQAATLPTEKKSKKTAMKPAMRFQPIAGPALPISLDKHQRLAALLARYQTDEITPAQYHQERAKILAEP